MQPDQALRPTPILYYDGDCGLCARTVQWCLRHDRRGVLHFSPLQGQTYAGLSASNKPTDLETMVLSDETGIHVRSRGVLRMLRHLGGVWSMLGAVGRVVPRPVADVIYNFVAKWRVVWFGRADACALPRTADRARFLP